ncbi:hypothetical protein [Actinomadura bangladeshensis]|uniref:Lipoprotein n=1 Tax=Actinomadura bangladeshensis TaxID=453573 RepID=A0A4R4NXW3_9ACTN|nr:hypothetical protein [Actinomadura bangladeshensis]TDC13974.1 hypothetical protein E1284_18265 [Actinomadura bangladeshensis]
MRTNRVVLAAVACVAAVALGGCGGGGEAKIPTAAGGAAAPSAAAGKGGGDEVAVFVQSRRDYVTCLRKNGVDVPDPDAKGNIDFGGDRTIKKDPKFLAAAQKCSGLLKPVPESIEKGNQPKLTAEQIRVKQRYAKCMQENGAADFPDPDSDGYVQGEWDQSSAGAKRAIRICGPIVGVPASPGPAKG